MESRYESGSMGTGSMYPATGGDTSMNSGMQQYMGKMKPYMDKMQPYMDKAMQQVQHYQQNPDELKALMSNKTVLAIGAALGLALLTGQIARKR